MTPQERRSAAITQLGELVVEKAAQGRHPLPDSDLYDEQPAVVQISTTLGVLRRAGLGSHPDYGKRG